MCTLLNKYFISFSAYFTQVSLSPAQIKMSSPRNKSSFDTANQEWAEILLTADEQSSTSVRLAPADPTPLVVDVNKALSAQDLISLKKRDPFLYYSIPGVCEATVRHKQVDMHQLARDGLSRNCASCPASIQTVTTTSEQTLGQAMDPLVHEWLNLAIRWAHVMFGIAWIGSSLYFMWLDASLEPPDPPRAGVL